MIWSTKNQFQRCNLPPIQIPKRELEQVRLIPERRMVEARWEGGETTVYPYIWLRDNCQCHTCFHPYTLARNTLMSKVPANAEPQEMKVNLSITIHSNSN